MATFLTENDLNAQLKNLFEFADELKTSCSFTG